MEQEGGCGGRSLGEIALSRGGIQGVAAWIRELSRGRLALLLLGLFGLVHLAYYRVGLRFDGSPLPYFFQFLDVNLLRHRLLESLFYLHSQPPLFNLYLGVVLKLFPRGEMAAFQACALGMGFGLYAALFLLLRRLSVSRALALILSTGFLISPSFIVYEHWLFYTFPLALLMTGSGLLFAKALRRTRFREVSALLWVVCSLCLMGSLFHLVYLLLVPVVLWALRPAHRRPILLAAAAPVLLLTGLYVKNYVLFGQFTTSSWLGMNFSVMTVRAVPIETRMRLVTEGKLTPLALIPRFSEAGAYPPEYLTVHGFATVPALRRLYRESGYTNYNSLAYLRLSQDYLRDDLYVLRRLPQYYLIGLVNAWLSYFQSSTDYPLIDGNVKKIALVNSCYDYLCYGRVPGYQVHPGSLPIYYAPFTEPRLYLFLLLGLPALVVCGGRLARRSHFLSPEQKLLLWYLCANIVYVALAANSFEVGENQRIRFMTDPLSVALLGAVLQHSLLPRFRRGKPAHEEGVVSGGARSGLR